jgi:hypothetical protein
LLNTKRLKVSDSGIKDQRKTRIIGKTEGKEEHKTIGYKEFKKTQKIDRLEGIEQEKINIEKEKLQILKDLRDGNISDEGYRRELIESGVGDMYRLWRTRFIKCQNPESISPDLFEEAIYRAHGVKGVIARLLGLSYAQTNRLIKKFGFQQLLKDERESIIDLAECRLFEATQYGEEWAVKMVLKCLGRSRGWTEERDAKLNKGSILEAIEDMSKMDEDEMKEYDKMFEPNKDRK